MSLLRKTTQNPLPVCKPETGKNQYDIYPTHDLGADKIFCDYTSLARRLAGQKQVVVDGYVGVRFDLFRQELNRALTQLGIRPVWWSVDAALRPQEEIERLVAPYLGGDDPIFGFRTPLRLEEFFDGEKLPAPRWPAGRASWSISTSRKTRSSSARVRAASPTWGPRSPNPRKRCTSGSISSTGSY